jgi:hypothetical protein
VLIAITLHANGDGKAFPSLARVAALVGIDRTKVPQSIKKLQDVGLLTATRRRDAAGDWSSTVYEIRLDEEVLPRLGTPVAAAGNTVLPPAGTGGVAAGGTLTNQYQNRPSNRLARRGSRARVGAAFDQDGASADFERFWAEYPHRRPYSDPQKPARQKFVTALKRGVDPEAIIRGAENYRIAVERDGTDPRFVCQASRWLSEERWNDHQDAPEPARLRAGMI